MDKAELLTRLRTLHEELAALDDVDEQTRQMLSQIATDIDDLVDQQSSSEPVAAADDKEKSSGSDISDRIEKFESDHPTVTRFLAQMTDLLSMMGI